MAEHLPPQHPHHTETPFIRHSDESPDSDEFDQMRQTAEDIVADLTSSPALLSPPTDAIRVIVMETDRTEEQEPVWGIEPLHTRIFPDEAPTQTQREHARHYYLTLVADVDRQYRQAQTLPTSQTIIDAYTAYCGLVQEKNHTLASQDQLPDFTLAHLFASARRQNMWVIGWLADQRACDTPTLYEDWLDVILTIELGLAEAVQSKSKRTRRVR